MMIELEIVRKEFFHDRCVGGFYINGVWYAYTVEDTDRHLEDGGKKIDNETAIPRGRYKVIIDWSNRFQRKMPHILDVPQFTGIRIHDGIGPQSTSGCPLIGGKYDANTHNILDDRATFYDFFHKLEEWLKKDEVWITIS
jgi:hypothetical protein